MKTLSLLATLLLVHNVLSENPQQEDFPSGPHLFTRLEPGQMGTRQYETLSEKQGKWRSGGDKVDAIRDSDIILTPNQFNYLFKSGGKWRKAEIDERRRWTDNVIPYVIVESEFSEKQTQELIIAMDTLMNLTCLTFRPKQDSDKNWVKFTNGNGNGCNSQLGMMNWGEQAVNLGSGCKWRGLYLHEIGHALGLIHEHQRPDRDSHVNVVWRRVKGDYLDAFTLYKNEAVTDFGIPYDYSSIMHYEPEAFNDDQEITTQPRDPWKVELMYRVFYKTLSWTDTKILNQMYKCGMACNKYCPVNTYVDKNCNCISPKDIHDALCVNERPDQECYDRVKKGHCNAAWSAPEMNIECRKACGSCPTYGRDEVAQRLSKPYNECADRYHEPQRCAEWAANGDCEAFPWWMKRNCRKSCNACNWEFGRCRNYYQGAVDDQACDELAKNGECKDPAVKSGCQDSCQACGFQIPGKCEDTYPGCVGPAVRGECDHNDVAYAAHIQSSCRKSCNTCSLNRGACENELSDQECVIAAAQGKCRLEPQTYKFKCRKACDSCGYGVVDNSCEDVDPPAYCENYRRQGTCDDSKGYAWPFCASSCNQCEYARNPPCEDLHEDCESWAQRGECNANHQYMSTHCSKSCKTCDRLKLGTCHNLENDAYCEIMAEKGECQRVELSMRKLCRRSCGHCQAPKLERYWECKDVLSDRCEGWKQRGECESNPDVLKAYCHKTCGHCTA